jgi:nitrate reductase assembly molybdenum cofactor insertion protein NarJ
MTAVIGGLPPRVYGQDMTARDDVQRLAAVLRRPGRAHVAPLRNAQQAMTHGSGEAARQLGVFIERVAELTTEELRELHDETFSTASLAAVPRVADRLARETASHIDCRATLDTLAPALERLEADRNPFAYVVRALCCALLARASHPRKDNASLCDPQ